MLVSGPPQDTVWPSTVAVVNGSGIVVVDNGVDPPPTVTVADVVACVARLLAWFCALLSAEAGIGVPASWQITDKGVRKRLLSRSLLHSSCMQEMTSGRN